MDDWIFDIVKAPIWDRCVDGIEEPSKAFGMEKELSAMGKWDCGSQRRMDVLPRESGSRWRKGELQA
ncbi:MAG TPA: hypothetical protein VGA86_08675 [Desulfatiglandales bacterium]